MNHRHAKANPDGFDFDVNSLWSNLKAALQGSVPGSSDEFRNEYLLKSLLAKYPHGAGVSADIRRERALADLKESERRLRRLNEEGFPLRVKSILHLASRHIAEVIGIEPDMKLFERARHSDGASLDHKYGSSTSWHKYSDFTPLSVTPSALPYALAVLGNTPSWCAHVGAMKLNVVIHNKVSTVEKNAEKDRTIAVEAPMNMTCQLAVGGFFKSRLKRFGIDLFDQGYNQMLALQASCYAYMESFGPVPNWWSHRGLVTIDLKNASNSLSWRLVFELLSSKWFHLLDALRSKVGWIDDHYHRWEMFSSMGNGFTFELESLVFWAIARACQDVLGLQETPLGVFGDDLIVDRQVSDLLIATLQDVGFETNLEKTFTEGPFYESCGKHYHYGTDVTPIYIREKIDSVYRWIWMLNKLRLWSYSDHIGMCDPRVYPIWKTIYRDLPWNLRGGICDIMADDSIYQYNSQHNVAYVAKPITVRKTQYGVAALLAKWQTVEPEVETDVHRHIPWDSLTHAGKRALLGDRGGETPRFGFTLTYESKWFRIRKFRSRKRVDNFRQLLSYGFPQELVHSRVAD